MKQKTKDEIGRWCDVPTHTCSFQTNEKEVCSSQPDERTSFSPLSDDREPFDFICHDGVNFGRVRELVRIIDRIEPRHDSVFA